MTALSPAERPTLTPALLSVEGLSIRFGTTRSPLGALNGASFQVERGETVCLVGESGCGKTITALSILRLEPYRKARISAGDIVFAGQGLRDLGRTDLDRLRGRRIAMIFQEPMTAFDPLFSIGDQIIEAIQRHEPVSREGAAARALALLKRVRIPDPALRMKQIPEELSGGMRQRAMIAMALSCKPDLLIADEPTTALDVTIQAQILSLLREIQREDGMGILLITHDLGVAAQMADRIVVMYAGRVVEQGRAELLFASPKHPYTRALLHSAIPHEGPRKRRLQTIAGAMPRLEDMPNGCRFHPRCPERSERCTREEPELLREEPASESERAGAREVACFNREANQNAAAPRSLVTIDDARAPAPRGHREVLLEARHLTKHFHVRGGLFGRSGRVFALDDVSLSIAEGETFGLVGESGCGKSTLGRILVQLERPSAGELLFAGKQTHDLRGAEQKRLRRDMQMIFQDPYDSIDPRWTVFDIIAEPLRAQERLNAQALRARIAELLELVGLSEQTGPRYARELSGGQRQRVGIARAIALSPKFIVADEAVSALDLSVQAQILNLLSSLRERLGLTTLFIGHGLNVVRHVSDRIGVMYLGRLVEVGEAEAVFRNPAHPYSAALLASIPVGAKATRDTALAPLGELPSPSAPPSGCHFHPRCPGASERCRREAPPLLPIADGHLVACHAPLERRPSRYVPANTP